MGRCTGEIHSRNKSGAIKKYITCSEDAFTELRSEAKLLQQSHHPRLICLVCVCVCVCVPGEIQVIVPRSARGGGGQQ